jgi:bacterial/archaeal transporter family-2 protein
MDSKGTLLFLGLAFITGALIPIQAATNTAFSKAVGNPFATGMMVFVIGLLSMVLFLLFTENSFPTMKQLSAAPAYGYLGGLIVATYVVMITVLVPRIGVGTAIALIVTGQIFCAVIIDHFGFFGVHVRHIDWQRSFGMLLMIVGVYFVMKK